MSRPKKKKKDKSEECLECPICKLHCVTDKYTDSRCISHEIPGGYLAMEIAHYCLEHKRFHCLKHRQLCMKVYGRSVMTLEAPPPKEVIDKRKEFFEKEAAEMCRMSLWQEQIEFGIMKCAECGDTVCQCANLGDELVVPSILAKQQTIIDEQGDRKTKRIKDYTKYYESLEREEREEEEYWDNVLEENKIVNKIKLDHLQRTGYTIEETEIRDKIKKGEITQNQ